MDRREGMMLPGSAPYYMQRGMSGSGNTSGLQNLNPSLTSGNISFQSGSSGGATIPHTLVVAPSSTLLSRGSISASSTLSQGEPVRRKRGRPRKYGAQGAISLASTQPPFTQTFTPTQKRGRGRPPGSGRKQQLASFGGGWLSNTAGIGFTPHVIRIDIGEDITTKVMSFSQQGPRSICILSANGVISTVTLRQPSTSGGAVTYEGWFEILCLSGSFLVSDSGGSLDRIGSLSISLASPDGHVIGGGVGGVLIAASPIQVIVGSFLCSSSKTKKRAAESIQSAGISDHQTTDNSVNPADALSNQNLTPTSSMGGVWPSSGQMDLQTGHINIDLMQG